MTSTPQHHPHPQYRGGGTRVIDRMMSRQPLHISSSAVSTPSPIPRQEHEEEPNPFLRTSVLQNLPFLLNPYLPFAMAHAESPRTSGNTGGNGGIYDSESEDSVFSIFDNDDNDDDNDHDDDDDDNESTTTTGSTGESVSENHLTRIYSTHHITPNITIPDGNGGEGEEGQEDQDQQQQHQDSDGDHSDDDDESNPQNVKCTFCFQRLHPRKKPSPIPLFTVDSCGHQFHFRCMQSWLLTSQQVNNEKLRRCVTCQQLIIFNEPVCQMFFEMVMESRRHRRRRRRHH